MTCVLICGFETGSLNEVQASWTDANSVIQSTTKRTGGYAWKVGTVGMFLRFQARNTTTGAWLLADLATSYVRFYFLYHTKPAANNEDIFMIHDRGGAGKIWLRLTSAGNIQAYATDGTTQMGSDGSTTLAADTWYRIEVKCSTGSPAAYEVLIDGVSELSGTGNLSSTNAGYWEFGSFTNRNNQAIEYYYDDIYIDDAGYPGAGQCEIMQPNADGAYTTWAASAGDRWDCVDEVPIDNSDYVESTLTSNEAYTAALESAASAGISGTIKAAEQIIDVKRAGSANGTIRMRLRSNTTDSDTGTNYGSTSTEVTLGRIFETDPATSSAWTTSGLDGVEVGALERETSDKTRMYGAYLMVDFVPAAAATTKMFRSLLGVGI